MACPSKFSYIFVTLPTSSTGPMESRTTAQNLRVHQFGNCKPQFAWAEEEPGTSLFVHWDINHCNFPQRLCSHWWATDSVPAIPSMQRQELRALPSRCADIKCSISDAKARYKVAQSYHIVNERAQTVHVLVHWWFPVGCGQLRCQRKWPRVIWRFAI